MPEACLVIQDGPGADVNVALFLLWHASEGRGLTAAEVVAIDQLVADWRHDVVVPLRTARRGLKPGEADPAVAALRRQVKQSELEAERLQQEVLYRNACHLGHPVADHPAAAACSLRFYEGLLGTGFPPDAVTMLIDAAIATPNRG